jgi:hypothetical protein
MREKVTNYLFIIASTILVVSAALWVDERIREYVNYAYAVSGAIVAVIYLSNRYQGPNFRLKRLNIQQVVAALLLPFSSYLMFKQNIQWFVPLLISAFLQIYIVIIKIIEEKKEKKENI